MEPVTVRCTSCGHTMRFGADKVGRKARCPKCNTVVAIALTNGTPPEASEPAAPPAGNPGHYHVPNADEIGAYGVTEVAKPEEKPKEVKEKKDDKKKHKVLRKVKAIADPEEWERVRLGLLFVSIGTWLWLGAHLLQGLYVVLGNADYGEYDRLVVAEINSGGAFDPAQGGFWNVSPLNVLLGMISGTTFLTFAWACLLCSSLLRIGQYLLWGTGYITCLPVPNRFGTSGQVILLLGLGIWNLLTVIILIVLPVIGAYSYCLVPLLTPEVAMTSYNMERSVPINVLWMTSPFLECVLNLFVQFLLYLEPVVGCVFIWSVGRSIKEQEIETAGLGLVQLGLGQFFILMAFHLFSVTGASPVLVTVLRVLYTLWYAFLVLFILQYAAALMRTRAVLDKKITPENEAE